MYTTTVTTTAIQDLDFAYSSSKTFSASAKLSINENIPTGVIDTPVNFNFSTGSGVLLAFSSNIALYPLQIKTNSAGSPTNYFEIRTTSQLIFSEFGRDRDFNNDLVTNITQLFVSNTGTLPATLRIDSLFDGTPNI
jgi:hypothetical protein